MRLKRLKDKKEFEANYITWTSSEFQKNGELHELQLALHDITQRAYHPYISIPSESISIEAKDSGNYELIETTKIGLKNLTLDCFSFRKAKSFSKQYTWEIEMAEFLKKKKPTDHEIEVAAKKILNPPEGISFQLLTRVYEKVLTKRGWIAGLHNIKYFCFSAFVNAVWMLYKGEVDNTNKELCLINSIEADFLFYPSLWNRKSTFYEKGEDFYDYGAWQDFKLRYRALQASKKFSSIAYFKPENFIEFAKEESVYLSVRETLLKYAGKYDLPTLKFYFYLVQLEILSPLKDKIKVLKPIMDYELKLRKQKKDHCVDVIQKLLDKSRKFTLSKEKLNFRVS